MSHPHFWLIPWDKQRWRQHAPSAQRIVLLQDHSFLLREQNGLLFFRRETETEVTYTVAAPRSDELQGRLEGWDNWFVSATFRAKSRYSWAKVEAFTERAFPLFFRADGSGWCRESWNQTDIPFQHDLTHHDWMMLSEDRLREYFMKIYRGQIRPALDNTWMPTKESSQDYNICAPSTWMPTRRAVGTG